jgi:hypothetical protein
MGACVNLNAVFTAAAAARDAISMQGVYTQLLLYIYVIVTKARKKREKQFHCMLESCILFYVVCMYSLLDSSGPMRLAAAY